MAAINQNGGQNVTMVNISAVISPILIIFFSVFNISKVKEYKPDILFNFEIQYGG